MVHKTNYHYKRIVATSAWKSKYSQKPVLDTSSDNPSQHNGPNEGGCSGARHVAGRERAPLSSFSTSSTYPSWPTLLNISRLTSAAMDSSNTFLFCHRRGIYGLPSTNS